MGLPVSVALRGRHVDDGRADEAWAAVLADLQKSDLVFSTYRTDSVVDGDSPLLDEPTTAGGEAVVRAPLVEVW